MSRCAPLQTYSIRSNSWLKAVYHAIYRVIAEAKELKNFIYVVLLNNYDHPGVFSKELLGITITQFHQYLIETEFLHGEVDRFLQDINIHPTLPNLFSLKLESPCWSL